MEKLDAALRIVAPIDGVSFDGRIHFRDEATFSERDDAYRVIDDWDFAAGTWIPGSEQERLKAERDATAAAAALAERREAAKSLLASLASDQTIAWRALGVLMIEQLNLLRANPTKVYPEISADQARDAWQAKIDALKNA